MEKNKVEVVITGNVRVAIKNGMVYTNWRERSCKTFRELVELAEEKAFKEVQRNCNLSRLCQADIDDLHAEGIMGAIEGVRGVAKKLGIEDLETIDPTMDGYHAKAYVNAKFAILTALGKLKDDVKLSERTKRQFKHCKDFLEEHPDGKYTDEELAELAKKCWTSVNSTLGVLEDYKRFARTQFVSLDDVRPGYEGDVTYEETVEAEESDAEKDAKTQAVYIEFVEKMLNECDRLYANQKELLIDSLGLFGNKKLTDSACAKKYGIEAKKVHDEVKKITNTLTRYVRDAYGYDRMNDLFA